ncbi:MAG TPA: efflux transporter outer membrane subunit [Gammaproteobacteria bacterium]|jgi:NodT family efflux transporter outer membrane factor (OMF) lipoprotein|nr:efflux transporter outer membrane subunit [Gammaproteobacteria bacterium]
MDFFQDNWWRMWRIMTILLFVVLPGCMVGPDFRSPAPPQVDSYTASPLPEKTVSTPAAGAAGKAQDYQVATPPPVAVPAPAKSIATRYGAPPPPPPLSRAIPAEWWRLYHSQALNDLITHGLANSPTLTAAQAALRQAQETLNAQVGVTYYPSVTGALSGQRERFGGSSFGNTIPSSIFNVFNVAVNVSYVLDVFGAERRQIEALRAQVNYQQYELIATYLTLTTNIVTTAITVASLEEQVKATEALIVAVEGQLSIIEKQFRLGGVAKTNVLTQQTLVAQTRATLPPLEKSLAQSRHALAVLVGEFPNKTLPSIALNSFSLPQALPVTLPSDLVRQRPDIQAAEALLHAASAQVGVATANLFPQITLSGDYGGTSSLPATLLSSGNRVWDYGAQLSAPIFQGGSLLAKRRAAIASFDQAAAQYRQAVLQAFQNVADTLRALEMDAKTLHAQQAAETSAHRALILSQDQYRLGGVSYLTLLTAQQQYQQTVLGRIQAQAARYADTAALFQALGGGWWNQTSIPNSIPNSSNGEQASNKKP